MQKTSGLRRSGLAAAIAASVLTMGGCRQGPSDEELGKIIYEVPNVPGSEEAFPLPPLDPSAKSDEAAGPMPQAPPLGEDTLPE